MPNPFLQSGLASALATSQADTPKRCVKTPHAPHAGYQSNARAIAAEHSSFESKMFLFLTML
jgi:hypothetical protein